MLFFKEIVQDKMQDPDFKTLYESECHICSTTVKLIARLEETGRSYPDMAKALGVSVKALRNLKKGDCCDPLMVKTLCAALGWEGDDLLMNCKRYRESRP